MEENESGPVTVKDMDKCATIYRSNAVSFVYVCYHCAADFTDIDSTLKHIENHFQVVEITIDEKSVKSECTDFENASDTVIDSETIDPYIDVKAEAAEVNKNSSVESLKTWSQFDCSRCGSTFPSKFALRCHTAKDHLEQETLQCDKCEKKFKRDSAFKSHLRQHIDRGEVDWKCEGDGIRECSEQQVSTDSTIPEKMQPQKRVSEQRKPQKQKPKDTKKTGKMPAVKRKPEETEKIEDTPAVKRKPEETKKIEKNPAVKPKSTTQKSDKPKGEQKKSARKSKVTANRNEEKPTSLSTYTCHKCSNVYNTSTDLNDHLNSHSASEILLVNKCKECKIFYPTAFDLRLHVLEIHLSVEEFKCATCFLEFPTDEKLLLERHLQLHLLNNTAKWVNIRHGVCNNGMNATSFEEITTTAASPCEICDEKFYTNANLDEHTSRMHWDNESKLRCPQAECDTVFTKIKCYYAHQFEHRRVGPIVIETDMKILVANLNAYIAEQFVCKGAEDNVNRYKCSICSVEKDTASDIRSHVRAQHVYKTLPQPIKPILKERVTCNICGMAITRSSFKNHYRTHVDTKKFPCSFCNKVFSKNYSKTTHERMHTGEKPFQCDQCGKRFFSNSLLGAHKQQHDNTKYPCKICGRSFNIPSGYRRHMQTHRKDQSYECNICSKSFNTRVYLTRHMHKHNEKSFQCSFCENKFRSAKGRRQHEKLQHHYEPPL